MPTIKKNDSQESPEARPSTDLVLAEALSRLADISERQNQRPIEYGSEEWFARNPKRSLPFQLFMNGIRIDVEMLTDEDLELLRKIQVGRFFDRRIHVYRDATPDRGFHIDWPRKSLSDRLAVESYGNGQGFTAILRKLTTDIPDLT